MGILGGVAEVQAILLVINRGGEVRLSAHYVWMVPAAAVLFALIAALVLQVLGRWWPSARTLRTVVAVLVGLALFGPLPHGVLHPAAGLLLAAGIGVQVGRMARGRVGRLLFRIAPVVALAAVLRVTVLGVRITTQLREERRASLSALPLPRAAAPNVLLLILDTVRARGLLASRSYTVPQLARVAGHGVSFERAIAPAPWSLPAHASIFTGRRPIELSVDSLLYLDARHPTLAEAMAARGYVTAGFVANLLWTTRVTGLGRGFIFYDDYPVSLGQVVLSSSLGRLLAGSDLVRRLVGHHELLNRRDARDVTDAFLTWQLHNRGRPFFAFLNLFDAHEPWFPPGYSGSMLWPGPRWTGFRHVATLRLGEEAEIHDKWRLPPDESAVHASGYWDAIRSIDAELGRLFDELGRRGVLDHTVVIITSDHGEQLGEHGLYDHTNSLYLPALHVPLVILPPGGLEEPVWVPQVVSLRNLPATVLDLVGESSTEFPGYSLVSLWQGSRATARDGTPSDTAFAHLAGGYLASEDRRPAWYPIRRGNELVSLTTRTHHYVRGADGGEELYDWRSEFAESPNLAHEPQADSLLAAFRDALRLLMQSR